MLFLALKTKKHNQRYILYYKWLSLYLILEPNYQEIVCFQHILFLGMIALLLGFK